jgi:protein TonB
MVQKEDPMFETAVISVQHRRAPRAGLFTISVAAHTVVVAALILAGIQSLQFPNHAPNQLSRYSIAAPPPPIQQGSPQARPAQQQAARTQQPRTLVAPRTDVAPHVIPDKTVPLSDATATGPIDPNLPAGPSSDVVGSPDGVKDGFPIAQPPALPTRIYTTAEVNSPPVAIKRVSPDFPLAAQRMRLSGWVVVEGVIDRSGHIREPHVVGSSFAAFERPALDAVSQWEFKPGMLHGDAVDTLFQLRVTFTLH